MKKTLMVLFLCCFVVILSGCGKKNYTKDYANLETKLGEYAKSVYEVNIEPYVTPNYNIQTIKLNQIEQSGKDVSMFVDPKTKKACDKLNSYVDLVFGATKENGKREYTIKTHLVCGDYKTENK